MQAHVLAVFTVALAVAVATPGPGIVAVVSCALGRGFREAAAMTCGMVVGDLVYFSLAVLGLAALARSMGDFFLIIKLAGAAYLVWLGLKLWRAPVSPGFPAGLPPGPPRGFWRSLAAGLTVTLGNPKAIAFYGGLLPSVISLDRLTAGDAVTMGLIVIGVVGGIPTLYAFGAARARRFFGSSRRMRLMHRTAGTMLIGAGVAVAVK
jgi:threonine/homoserine/homoserine lactone efflux protein